MPQEPAGATDVSAGVRHVITVGGGRGGVGKSLLTVNLGVYLAQLGRNVLIADADLSGSSLHIQLGLDAPPLADRDAVEHLNVEPVVTSVPGLRLLPTPYDPTASSPFRPGRKARWLTRLRALPADYVLLHLGAGTSPARLTCSWLPTSDCVSPSQTRLRSNPPTDSCDRSTYVGFDEH